MVLPCWICWSWVGWGGGAGARAGSWDRQGAWDIAMLTCTCNITNTGSIRVYIQLQCCGPGFLSLSLIFIHCPRVPDLTTTVADPDPKPDPEPDGTETFGRIRIRSGTEINVSDQDSDPDSNPDPKLDPKKICKKGALFSG